MREAVLVAMLSACGAPGAAPDASAPDARAAIAPDAMQATGATATGAQWPEADALFHQDPRWLGGDAAYSVDLGGGRVVWLFGDSFVATSDAHVRTESRMPRNTIAVQTGLDPTTATMQFAWGTATDGGPASFFPERVDRWHWPGGGVRLPGGPLLVFLKIERPDPGPFHFAGDGWRVASVANPDDSPDAWQVSWLEPPAQAWTADATAIALDGEYVIDLATDAAHHGLLARIPVASLAAGSLDAIEWWDGRAWGAGPPAVVIADAGSEASLHFDASLGLWIHVASRGFGATTAAVRTARDLTGPWSAPIDAYTPPESSGPSPFVYAAKGHADLHTPDGTLAATYATNSFTPSDLFTPDGEANLYWPRFVRLSLAPTY